MKKITTILIALVFTFVLNAQPPMGGFPGGMPPMGGFPGGPGMSGNSMSVEETAKMKTDMLDQLVVLDEKQYKKIYSFQKSLAEELEMSGIPMMPPMGPMRGGFHGGPGMGGFPGGPGMGQNPNGAEEDEYTKAVRERNEKIRAKQDEKTAKKYMKILTPEQFKKWETFEKERILRQEQMRERMMQGDFPRPEGAPKDLPQGGPGFPPAGNPVRQN